MRQFIWTGEKNRPLTLKRPCECGCDSRGGDGPEVGYLTGSDSDGNGFTIHIKDEKLFARIEKVLDSKMPM